jgi:drug/metabolite transporter (DMT)-like permease
VSRYAHPLAGIALVIAACLCFSTLDTSTKFVSSGVPILMALWFRYAFQAVATAVVVLPLRGMAAWRTRHPRFHVLRGVLLLTSSVFSFASLKYMPVGEFTAIIMISPLVVTLLAATVLKETVSPLRWLLVAGGFAGTLVIIRPGAQTFQWATLLPLGLVVTNAWFQVLTSRMARTEDPVTMHLWTGWVGTLVATLILPFVWAHVDRAIFWALMGLMGLMGTIGHFLLILGYQRAPAATLTPYLYVQIAFSMVAGLVVFSHVPDGPALFGMVLIAVCGAAGGWLTVRENRVRIEPVEA